jgi:carbon-monoxide dehydrogenase medium subunit
MLAVHRSRALIPPFQVLRPRVAAEAAALQAACADALFMAGGIDLINRLKFGAPVTTIVHLGGVAGMGDIGETVDGLTIGAGVTHDQLAGSALIRTRLPALADAWPGVANVRIRLKGTVGGNVMARDPAYDIAPVLMAAGARLRFVGRDGGERVIDAAALTDPTGRPVPQPGLLSAIELPPTAGLRLAIERSLRPVLSLAVGLDVDAGGIRGGRAALGCAFAAPLAVALPLGAAGTPAELARGADAIARELAAGLPEPVSDRHASAAYRRRMVAVLLRRTLTALAEGPA